MSGGLAGDTGRHATRILLGLLAGAAGIVTVYVANRQWTDVPFPDLVRDPGHVTGASPWVGALTFVGWFGWTTAAVLLFTAGWLRRRGRAGSGRTAFLVATAGLTVLALADDAYQLHERVLVDATGIGERGWYLVYAAVVCAWAVVFRRQLLRSPAELAVSVVLIASSQAIEAVPFVEDAVESLPGRPVSWEESLKLLGIGAFVGFAVRELASAATAVLGHSHAPPSGDEEAEARLRGEHHSAATKGG